MSSERTSSLISQNTWLGRMRHCSHLGKLFALPPHHYHATQFQSCTSLATGMNSAGAFFIVRGSLGMPFVPRLHEDRAGLEATPALL